MQTTLSSGCIRSLRFDLILVLGSALVAIAAGLAVVARPTWFAPILLADVWILGSQHVIATYTRLCFDRATFLAHRFLVLGVPWIVLFGVVAAIYITGGTVVVTTIYLYWQWHHYSSQSYGVQRIYACKCRPESSGSRDWLTALAMFAVPLWGILHRSLQKQIHPEQVFLTFDFWALPVSDLGVRLVGGAALGLCVAWLVREAWTFGGPGYSFASSTYVVVHWVVFLTGYYLINDITYGWLVINVWHNLQYVLLVWMYNNNRFRSGVDPGAWILSYISQRKFVWLYFPFCIACAAIFYKLLAVVDDVVLTHFITNSAALQMNPEFFRSSGLLKLNLLPTGTTLNSAAALAMVTYQVINFHHYIADASIWRVGKKEHQVGLGLASASTQSALEAVV